MTVVCSGIVFVVFVMIIPISLPPTTGSQPNSMRKIKRELPPRLWCDNCLVFDSHDTEQCPSQQQQRESPAPVRKMSLNHRKLVTYSTYENVDRLYCDHCGVFDSHDTAACADPQTY